MKKFIITESQARMLLEKNISKDEIKDVVDSKEFEKKVKTITGDVIKKLFQILWQKNNFYDNEIRK